MRLIDADSVLKGIEELKQSPWFNRGKEVVSGDPGFQHIGYIERKEAVEVVRDLCIRKEPTVGGWISVKDRLPEESGNVLVCVKLDYADGARYVQMCHYSAYKKQFGCFDTSENSGFPKFCVVTHWMPLPEIPKEGGA